MSSVKMFSSLQSSLEVHCLTQSPSKSAVQLLGQKLSPPLHSVILPCEQVLGVPSHLSIVETKPSSQSSSLKHESTLIPFLTEQTTCCESTLSQRTMFPRSEEHTSELQS